MKWAYKCSLLMGALMFMFNFQVLHSQPYLYEKLQLYFFTKDDNAILTLNEVGTKKLSFQVKGLKDNDEASLFISTIKLYNGIVDFQISELLSNLYRQVNALCHPSYTLNNRMLFLVKF